MELLPEMGSAKIRHPPISFLRYLAKNLLIAAVGTPREHRVLKTYKPLSLDLQTLRETLDK
jgi:hypothetical protein